jgi:hypothetical protein
LIPITRSLEERFKRTEDHYRAKGYTTFGHIIAARESQEDAIIGRLDHGEYFKATVENWTRIDTRHLDSVPQAFRDMLNTDIDYPMVWLINKESLRDNDYAKHYRALLDNALVAQFGRLPKSVILTAYDQTIPAERFSDADGKFVPSRFAFYSLMAAAPNLDTVEPPPKPPAERGDFSYRTSTKTTVGPGSETVPRVSAYYFHGEKTRVDTGNTSTIIDFAAQTTTSVNNISKTYVVRNFAGLSATTDARDLEGTNSYWFGPKPKIIMKETRQKRIVSGFNATLVLMTVAGLHHQKRKIEMEIEIWVSPDIPGGSKLREFYKRNAGNLPQIVMGFPWDAMLGAGSAGARAALADAQRKTASMDGVIVEQIVRVKADGRRSSFVPMDASGFSTKNVPDAVFAIPVGYQRRQ